MSEIAGRLVPQVAARLLESPHGRGLLLAGIPGLPPAEVCILGAGEVDFVRGAQRSKGGKAIIAFPSTAKGGKLSRIVPTLLDGAGVVTSRGDVNYIATEYGVAQLHGKTIRERARSLINIAHPKFREELEKFATEHHYL